MTHATPRATRRHLPRLLASVAVAVLAAGLGLVGATGAQAQPGPAPSGKIQPELQQALAGTGTTDFWVRFADRADLSQARQIGDWVARGEAVAAALRQTAQASQTEVRQLLDGPFLGPEEGQPASYRSYWATNAIFVTGGTAALADRIAASATVEGLYAPIQYELVEPTRAESERRVQAVEWGIANIQADQVWDQHGVRGEGITVASIDTGVEFDHPALVAQYRGNLGGGDFDHNYNWFDVTGACPDAPCDNNDHGTHTMGTMAGDDGGVNQIGVAPRANWIAANGCCPSDQALIDSGQWLLEPTDLNGENPDASKRPHIINNSWGTQNPSNDPFMEDVLAAWEAAGILGVWANGNSGPGCASSGSPGSRILNYSAGAYDINNTIAGFSGRGPGQDGEIKPSIAAPGVNVRSAVRNQTYANFNGTSMAAPHVAGAAALLWSAAPALVGDISQTKTLLDGTARDTEDLQCGGTAEDNNVFGEGRLDALALVGSVAGTGTLTGVVSDAATGDGIAGATVAVTGEVDRVLTTGPDGSYTVLLPVGDYSVTASAFGYSEQSAQVSIANDETTAQDFPLEPTPSVTVSGLVRDGSGHGWPVYARIGVAGQPSVATHSNPFTGRYRLELPADASHTLVVTPQYPGYQELTETVEVGDGNVVRDLSPVVDAETCTAPGYRFAADGAFETFESGDLPAGWSVVDNVGNGQVWRFDDPGNRGNLTGGDGGFAIVDSDDFGSGSSQDTELVSPVVDLSGVDEPVIRFNQDFRWFSLGGDEFTDVDLSLDGGATWENVFHQEGGNVRGPRQETVPIPQAAGEPQVQARFHYGDASFDWWWQLDNVLVGTLDCEPVPGGLVAGFVRDRNTGTGLNGATVVSVPNPDERGDTFATPDDPALADGFYSLFSSQTGRTRFTASAPAYTDLTRAAVVDPDWVTRRNFRLGAGQLAIEPAGVSAEVPFGGAATETFTISNTGTAPVELELAERGGSFEILRPDGTRVTEQELLTGAGAPVRRIPVSATLAELTGQASDAGRKPAGSAQTGPQDEPWTNLPNAPTALFDNSVALVEGDVYSFSGVGADTAVYRFDAVEQVWTRLGDMPGASRQQANAGVIDGLVYLVSGWSDLDTTTMIYDPASDGWSTGANAPAGRAAAGTAVLDGQLYLVGGCTTTACEPYADTVFRYDPASDSWQELASYPVPTAWQACGGIDGALYCAGGVTDAGASVATYRYDPGTDSWAPVADMPFDLWGGGYTGANGLLLLSAGATANSTVITNEGLAYDPQTDTWDSLPASNNTLFRPGSTCGFHKVGGGTPTIIGIVADDLVEMLPGFDQCEDATDVPWLEVSPTTATLAPGESVVVTVSLSADVAQPGTFTADLRVREDTPYPVPPVPVTMLVTPPPTWGKLMGTVEAVACDGSRAPLADATVHLSTWVMELTLFTGPDGGYAHWLDFRHSPFFVIVAKDGYQPQFRETEVVAGEVTVEDWVLRQVCSNGFRQF